MYVTCINTAATVGFMIPKLRSAAALNLRSSVDTEPVTMGIADRRQLTTSAIPVGHQAMSPLPNFGNYSS